jgi:hypothetical protein
MATAAPRPREVTAGLPVLCMLMIWGCDLCLVQLLLVQLHLVCGITQLLTTVLGTLTRSLVQYFSKEKPKVYCT